MCVRNCKFIYMTSMSAPTNISHGSSLVVERVDDWLTYCVHRRRAHTHTLSLLMQKWPNWFLADFVPNCLQLVQDVRTAVPMPPIFTRYSWPATSFRHTLCELLSANLFIIIIVVCGGSGAIYKYSWMVKKRGKKKKIYSFRGDLCVSSCVFLYRSIRFIEILISWAR